MAGEWLFRIKDVEKRYGNVQALRLPELTLHEGDRVLVSGTNGAGKSTFLRVAAGFSSVDAGQLERAPAWKAARVGYLPQTGGIYRDLTIRGNHRTLCRLLGAREREKSTAIETVLGIEPYLDTKVGNLSGGHQRLSALYCLLTSGARILLLDEPFATLDFRRQAALREALEITIPDLLLLMIAEHREFDPAAENATWTRVLNLD